MTSPRLLGLGRGEDPAREHQLLRLRGADETGSSQLGADVARGQADADERGVELRRLRRDADVGAKHECVPPAAGPLTAAMMGCGSERMCGMSAAICFCTAKPDCVGPKPSV